MSTTYIDIMTAQSMKLIFNLYNYTGNYTLLIGVLTLTLNYFLEHIYQLEL